MCLPWSHQGPVLFQSLTSASSVDSEPLQGRAGSVFFYQLSVPSLAHVVLYKCLLHEQTKRHRPNVRPSFYQSGGLIRLCPGGSRRAARVPRGTLFPGPRINATHPPPATLSLFQQCRSHDASPQTPSNAQYTDRWPERDQVILI